MLYSTVISVLLTATSAPTERETIAYMLFGLEANEAFQEPSDPRIVSQINPNGKLQLTASEGGEIQMQAVIEKTGTCKYEVDLGAFKKFMPSKQIKYTFDFTHASPPLKFENLVKHGYSTISMRRLIVKCNDSGWDRDRNDCLALIPTYVDVERSANALTYLRQNFCSAPPY